MMTKNGHFLLAAMLLGVISCKKEQASQHQPLKPVTVAASATTTIYGYATDSSGLVQTVVVREQVVGLANEISVTVPDDYILIGGGAFSSANPGNFLTASYPNDSLSTWHAKFFLQPRLNNVLTAYAVGLKLAGLTKAQLQANLQLVSGSDSASVDSSFFLIGGGTKVTYVGNGQSLIKTKPEGNTWYSGTKNYLPNDSVVMTTYAIGLKKDIPSFGAVVVEKVTSIASVNSINDEGAIIKLDNKWVTACPGGEIVYDTTGRRLISIYPLTRSVSVFSAKDAGYAPNGATAAYMLKLRKAY
jgi:hypothetical protein